MRIVKSVLLEKKSEAYRFLRIWIAVSNYVLFTLITNEKCWLYDLLFHGWKLDLFFVKGKMRVPIPPIFDFTNFSKKRFLNKYFYFTIFFNTFLKYVVLTHDYLARFFDKITTIIRSLMSFWIPGQNEDQTRWGNRLQ